MRRFRVVALFAAAAVLAVGVLALSTRMDAGVDSVARRFVVTVGTPPSVASGPVSAAPGARASAGAHEMAPSVAPRPSKPVQTGAVMVGFRADTAKTRAFVSASRGRVIHSSAGQLVVSLPTPRGQTPNEYRDSLAKRPDVAYASPDEIGRFQPTAYIAPTDPLFTASLSWHWWLNAVNAPSAWQTGFGSATTPLRAGASAFKVAVIDTGVYMSQPDMADCQTGKDEFASYSELTGHYATDNDITPDPLVDVPWHGTAVAGAVGAAVNNGYGTVGVGYDVIPVGYKVAGPTLSPSNKVVSHGIGTEAAAQAIYDATDAGCKVVNMSFGGPGPEDPAMLAAEGYAHSHGVLLISAAGNDGTNVPSIPAADPNVLSISAITPSGSWGAPYTLASFSSYGSDIALSAPGDQMWLPYYDSKGSSTQDVAGTSFAAPTVAGAAAFLWRAAPFLTTDQITTLLESSAVDLGTPGRDDLYGHGMLDMNAAYSSLVAQYPALAKPAGLTLPPYTNSHSVTATWSPSPGTGVVYSVSLDGSIVATTSATSLTLGGVAPGTHTVAVQPTSAYNWWSVASAVSATTTVDVTPPAVSGFSILGKMLAWSVAETNPYTVQAYVDTATPSAVAGDVLTLASLTSGTHTLHVDATDAAGNSSGWVTWDFSYGEPPGIQSIVVTDALAATVSWPTVDGATSYDYIVNGGGMLSTAGPGFTLAGLTGGVTAVQVRSVLASTTSAWATATVTDVVVVPGVPAVPAAVTVHVPSVTVSWPAEANAKWYEYAVDGGPATTTFATSVAVPGLPLGATTVAVRAFNNLSESAWATATVTYAKLTTNLAKPSVSPASPNLRKTVTFSAWLAPVDARTGAASTLSLYHLETKYVYKRVAGKLKRVKVSYWHARGTLTMSSAASGTRALLTRKTTLAYTGSWRATVRFGGSASYLPSASTTPTFKVK